MALEGGGLIFGEFLFWISSELEEFVDFEVWRVLVKLFVSVMAP
jgi:hypothetical protein